MRKSVLLLFFCLGWMLVLGCGLSSLAGPRAASPAAVNSTPVSGLPAAPAATFTAAPSSTPMPTATATPILPTAGPTVTGGFGGYYLAIVSPTAGQPARLSLFDAHANEVKGLWTLPAMPEKSFFEMFASPKKDLLLISTCNDLGYCNLYTWNIQKQAAQKITQREIKVISRQLQWFSDGSQIFLTWPGNSVSKSSYTLIRLADGKLEEKEFLFHQDIWLSPDGTQMLYLINRDLLISDLEGGQAKTMVKDELIGQYSWFPDGKRIWFNSYEGNKAGATLNVLNLETRERVKLTGRKGGYFYGVVISPDQKYALFRLSTPGISNDPATNNLLWVVPTDGSREAIKIGFSSQDNFNNTASNYRFSPDGTMILFNGFPLSRKENQPGNYSIRPDGSELTPLPASSASFLLKDAFWMHIALP